MKGAWTPPTTMNATKEPPQRRLKRHKNDLTDSLLESGPFSVMVPDREHCLSEDEGGKLHGPFGQQCPGKYHHAKICK